MVGPPDLLPKGSRNAVVALKRHNGNKSKFSRKRKQERRGGIETEIAEEPVDVEAAKQERRGGIETRARTREVEISNSEAGTPWWH